MIIPTHVAISSRMALISLPVRNLSGGFQKVGTMALSLRNYGTRRESKQWKQRPNRKARLDIILTQDVHKLGIKGQIVQVKHGYGRNHLLPQKMAVYATHYNVEDHNAFTVEKGGVQAGETENLTRFLENKELMVRVAADMPVTEHHVSRAFRQCLQLHVPVDLIELPEPITTTAGGSVTVRVSEDTPVTLPVKLDTTVTKKQQRKVDKRQIFLSRRNKEDETD